MMVCLNLKHTRYRINLSKSSMYSYSHCETGFCVFIDEQRQNNEDSLFKGNIQQ